MIDAKLKMGEVIVFINDKNIIIQKWKDKRDVLILSTKHTDTLVTKQKCSKEIL